MTDATTTAVVGGVYAPPTFQTAPSALRRIMAVWLEQPTPGGALEAHMYVSVHTDPRPAAAFKTPEHFHYTLRPGDKLLTAVLGLALALECGAVWILDTPAAREHCPAAALEVLELADTPADPEAGVPAFPWLAHELSAGKHATELAGIVIQRRREDTGKGQGIPVGVYMTWVGEVWPRLAPAATPVDTAARWLEAVTLAAYCLDAQLRFSPSYTGMVTLRQVIADKERRAGRALARLSPERAAEVAACKPTYLQWRSRFLEHNLSLSAWTYVPATSSRPARVNIPVYVYDRNWSFVTAAREMPVGDPVATVEYQKSAPGYYHLLSATPPAGWPTTRPGPFHTKPTGAASGAWPGVAVYDLWAWEPQIRLARALGWQVEIEYGWYWPTMTDLRPWSTRLWNARRGARAHGGVAGALAESIVKRVGVATIGRLGQRGGRAVMRNARAREVGATILARHVDAEGELTGFADVKTATLAREDLSRPEWWATDIANANERTLAALLTYAPDDTLLAYVDGIYTLLPHDELAGSADKVGGWRAAGVIYVPATDLETLDTLSPYELVKALGRYAHAETDAGEALETARALEAEGLAAHGE